MDIDIIIQKVPTREAQSLKHLWRVEKPAPKKGDEATVVATGFAHAEREAIKKARLAATNFLIAEDYGENHITLEDTDEAGN